jgi:Protein of unknown function (DUF1353)
MAAMIPLGRRAFIRLLTGGAIATKTATVSTGLLLGTASAHAKNKAAKGKGSVERWMNSWMAKQPRVEKAGGILFLGRFRDPTYFTTAPIFWRPNEGQAGDFERVEVPVGFVTDLASIPRIFWSELRPDGDYAHAAVIHDYLYWTQTGSRDKADEIFRFEMRDLGIANRTIATIYRAVRAFGGSAWENNARLKANGEKRILKIFPDDPSVLWEDWKQRPEVFA